MKDASSCCIFFFSEKSGSRKNFHIRDLKLMLKRIHLGTEKLGRLVQVIILGNDVWLVPILAVAI